MLNSDPNGAGATVGIIKSCFSSIAGILIGVYVAQNYKGPNVDETYRKPRKKDRIDEY